MKYAALVIALLTLATPASAQDMPIATFGDVGYGGNGCPDGTALVIPAADSSSVTLQLDAYKVGDNGRALDRKTCAIAVPVAVPDGMAVAVDLVGLRGKANLPDGAEATLSVEAFTAGDSGEILEYPLAGPTNVNFYRFVSIPRDKLVWSGCGEDTNLRINTSLRAKGNENAAVSLTGLSMYRVVTKPC